MKCIIPSLTLLAASTGLFSSADLALGQGTAFTYQGRLSYSGQPASGSFDLTFSLFNTNTNGIAIVGPITNTGVMPSNGIFTVNLDFGRGTFNGADSWLEIGARPSGNSQFTILSPRQPILSAPYAMHAPGSVVWQVVTNTSIQMLPNNGYIMTYSSPGPELIATLPVTPNVGDVVGIIVRIPANDSQIPIWRIAQNDGQSIFTSVDDFPNLTTTGTSGYLEWINPSTNYAVSHVEQMYIGGGQFIQILPSTPMFLESTH